MILSSQGPVQASLDTSNRETYCPDRTRDAGYKDRTAGTGELVVEVTSTTSSFTED